MFLHAEKMARSRSVTYGKDGSVEHLFALIDLCKLIEQHKKFILGHAEPLENIKSKVPEWNTEKFDTRFAFPIGRDWKEADRIREQWQRPVRVGSFARAMFEIFEAVTKRSLQRTGRFAYARNQALGLQIHQMRIASARAQTRSCLRRRGKELVHRAHWKQPNTA